MIKDVVDGKEIILTREKLEMYTLEAMSGLLRDYGKTWSFEDNQLFYDVLKIKKKECFDYLDKFFRGI